MYIGSWIFTYPFLFIFHIHSSIDLPLSLFTRWWFLKTRPIALSYLFYLHPNLWPTGHSTEVSIKFLQYVGPDVTTITPISPLLVFPFCDVLDSKVLPYLHMCHGRHIDPWVLVRTVSVLFYLSFQDPKIGPHDLLTLLVVIFDIWLLSLVYIYIPSIESCPVTLSPGPTSISKPQLTSQIWNSWCRLRSPHSSVFPCLDSSIGKYGCPWNTLLPNCRFFPLFSSSPFLLQRCHRVPSFTPSEFFLAFRF